MEKIFKIQKIKERKLSEGRNVKRKDERKRVTPTLSFKWRKPKVVGKFHSSFLRTHCHLPAPKQNAHQEKVDFIPNFTVLSLPELTRGLQIHSKINLLSGTCICICTSAFAHYAENGNTLTRWGTALVIMLWTISGKDTNKGGMEGSHFMFLEEIKAVRYEGVIKWEQKEWVAETWRWRIAEGEEILL